MVKYETDCVGCGKYCIDSACIYYNNPHYYCDNCREPADYNVDSQDFCESCAEDYLQNCFDELSLREQAEILDVDFKDLRW